MSVDAYTSQPNYVEHLLPTWRALGPDAGRWFAPSGALCSLLRRSGVDPARVAQGRLPRARVDTGLVLVASGGDARTVRPRSVVLVEHGAGQTYDLEHEAYAGGPGREGVVLFLCPNERVAELNAARYAAPAEAVGSPRLDDLMRTVGALIPPGSDPGCGGLARRAVPPQPPITALPSDRDSPRCRGVRTVGQERRRESPTGATAADRVVLSFHWNCRLTPETGWALPHFMPALSGTVRDLVARGIEVVGAGHPRYESYFRRLWAKLRIEHVADFGEAMTAAAAYVVDNSSSAWEAAAMGVPVVLMNAPTYRRDVEHWPRFWAEARVGHQVDEPEDLGRAIDRALEGPAPGHWDSVDAVFPLRDGLAAERSAAAIRRVLSA